MRNPRSSNSVSAIQRFVAELFVDWFFDLVMANPRGKPRAMVVIFCNEGEPNSDQNKGRGELGLCAPN
jgi:hypothetical protein